MTKIVFVEIFCYKDVSHPDDGIYTSPVYPECPYFCGDLQGIKKKEGVAGSDDCKYPHTKWHQCSTNHILPITCPFDIHKELYGVSKS